MKLFKILLLSLAMCNVSFAEEVHGKVDFKITKKNVFLVSLDNANVCTFIDVKTKNEKYYIKSERKYKYGTACGILIKIGEDKKGCKYYSLNFTFENLYDDVNSGTKYVAVAQFYDNNHNANKFLNVVYCPKSNPDLRYVDIQIKKDKKNNMKFLPIRNIKGYAFG